MQIILWFARRICKIFANLATKIVKRWCVRVKGYEKTPNWSPEHRTNILAGNSCEWYTKVGSRGSEEPCPNAIRTQLTKYDSAKPMSDAIRRNEKKWWSRKVQCLVTIGHSMESTRVLWSCGRGVRGGGSESSSRGVGSCAPTRRTHATVGRSTQQCRTRVWWHWNIGNERLMS